MLYSAEALNINICIDAGSKAGTWEVDVKGEHTVYLNLRKRHYRRLLEAEEQAESALHTHFGDVTETEVCFAGGAPKRRRQQAAAERRERSRSRSVDFDLTEDPEGEAITVKIDSKDPEETEWRQVRVKVGPRQKIQRLMQLVADYYGRPVQDVGIYYGRSNLVAPPERLIREGTAYEFILSGAREDKLRAWREERRIEDAQRRAEIRRRIEREEDRRDYEAQLAAGAPESVHSSAPSPEPEDDEGSDADGPPRIPRGPEDEAEIDWRPIDVGNRGPRAPFPFLIQDRQGGWRPYMLWCPEDAERNLETAWIAGHLQVQTWRVNLQRAEPELEEYYGVEALTLAYCIPTVADLAGGGKRVKLRSRSSRCRREEDQRSSLDDQHQAQGQQSGEPSSKRDKKDKKRAKVSPSDVSREQEWEAVSEPAAAAPDSQDTLMKRDAPWLLGCEGQFRCLLCRRWVTPEHMSSKGHQKALGWFAQADAVQREEFLAQRRRAFRIKQLAASGGTPSLCACSRSSHQRPTSSSTEVLCNVQLVLVSVKYSRSACSPIIPCSFPLSVLGFHAIIVKPSESSASSPSRCHLAVEPP